MLSARTVFEENFDNDEAFRLFCSEVGDERAELAWHGPNHSPTSAPSWPGMAPTTRRTTSLSTPDGLRPLNP